MKKIWKIRRDEEAVSPVIATILMVAITVVLAAVLYIMVTTMTHAPTTLESVGGTLETATGGWLFTCTSGTKDFPDSSTYIFIQTETGGTVLSRTLLSAVDTQAEYNTTGVWFHDNNADDKLNAGDTIFISSSTTGASAGNAVQILTSSTILYDRTLP